MAAGLLAGLVNDLLGAERVACSLGDDLLHECLSKDAFNDPTQLAAAIKAQGSVAVVQLHHAGMRSPAELIGEAPVCPSDNEEFKARALTGAEVEQLVADFIAGAVRSQKLIDAPAGGLAPRNRKSSCLRPRSIVTHLVANSLRKRCAALSATAGVICRSGVRSSRIQTARPWVPAIRSPSRG